MAAALILTACDLTYDASVKDFVEEQKEYRTLPVPDFTLTQHDDSYFTASWNSIPDVTGYEIRFGTSNNLASARFHEEILGTPTTTPGTTYNSNKPSIKPHLERGSLYYVWMRTVFTTQKSRWSGPKEIWLVDIVDIANIADVVTADIAAKPSEPSYTYYIQSAELERQITINASRKTITLLPLLSDKVKTTLLFSTGKTSGDPAFKISGTNTVLQFGSTGGKGQLILANNDAPGIVVETGSTFEMYDNVTIQNCTGKTSYGGGVTVNGTFYLYGGTIQNNKAPYGGGIYVAASGVLDLLGGVIKNNTATDDDGGGVYLATVSPTVNQLLINGDPAPNRLPGDGSVVIPTTFSGNSLNNWGRYERYPGSE